MPRRKGYGIPPTKRIKFEDDVLDEKSEEDENEDAISDIQKENNENRNAGVEETNIFSRQNSTPTTTFNNCSNNSNSNIYFHKKFKKMATISDDDLDHKESESTAKASMVEIRSSIAPLPVLESVTTANVMTIPKKNYSAFVAIREDFPAALGRYVCRYCKLVCNKPSVLEKHIRAHTNERPYPCGTCGFAFKTKSNLYKHQRSRSHTLKADELSGEDSAAAAAATANSSSKLFGTDEEPLDSSVSSSEDELGGATSIAATAAGQTGVASSKPAHHATKVSTTVTARTAVITSNKVVEPILLKFKPQQQQPQQQQQVPLHQPKDSSSDVVLREATKFSSKVEHVCSLCDQSYENYEKLKNHILFECRGKITTTTASNKHNNITITTNNNNNNNISNNNNINNNNHNNNNHNNNNNNNNNNINNNIIGNNNNNNSISLIAASKKITSSSNNNATIVHHNTVPAVVVAPTPISTRLPAVPESKQASPSYKMTGTVNGSVVIILHAGKAIPYVPGMPGPQTLSAGGDANSVSSCEDETPVELNIIEQDSDAESPVDPFPVAVTSDGAAGVAVNNMNIKVPIPDSVCDILLNTKPITNEVFTGKIRMPVKYEIHHQKDKKVTLAVTNNREQMVVAEQEQEQELRQKSPNCVAAITSSGGSSVGSKFVRPTFLPLKPGTYSPKRVLLGSTSTLALVSPETPRPKKSYGQLYIGGNAYTYLGMKCSTRTTFCTVKKSQPTYVLLSPEHSKISMYSNWKVRSESDVNLPGIPISKALACYDSRQKQFVFTVAHSKLKDAVTHSSYLFKKSDNSVEEFKNQQKSEPIVPGTVIDEAEIDSVMDSALKRHQICEGGIESTDEYTYIRGRGRGRYVCLECGIRCKKPSMLKKHIRTHTNVRPYTCKHCTFSFKTKGNLTKHMKSKAHYKKCTDLGIVPVPTLVDESVTAIAKMQHDQNTVDEGDYEEGEEGDEEVDEDEDENEEEDDDFDESEEIVDNTKCRLEREAVSTLLSLSKMTHQSVAEQYANAGLVSLNIRPFTYPYRYLTSSTPSQLSSTALTPTLTLISEQKEREKVSQNTGLAREFQPAITNNRASIKDAINESRYYFGSGPNAICTLSNDSTSVAVDLPESTNDSSDVTFGLPIDLSNKSNEKLASQPKIPPPVSQSKLSPPILQSKIPSPVMQSKIPPPVSQPKIPPPVSQPDIAPPVSQPEIPAVTAAFTVRSPKKLKVEFMPPSSGPSPKYGSILEDGRSKCEVCNKIFSTPSQLRIHLNIHYFEKRFRCETCAVSFHTKAQLHKHLDDSSHRNKINMNTTNGGVLSSNNPRPFKCDDCSVGFRIPGHLAKHLRSKMHIMKLECLGKLPFGTYAEMDRRGMNMNDIDTTDCENSLESLKRIAENLLAVQDENSELSLSDKASSNY